MKPYLSLVIPYHNSVATIGNLLASVAKSAGAPPLEVIIVDDRSDPDKRARDVKLNGVTRKFPVRILEVKGEGGPGTARNRGVAAAKGKFVVFLDSDVQLFPDALHNLATIYREDPDVVAVTGVWVKDQKTDRFFPNYKALRDWGYWINERDANGYYYLFSTRIASIKRSVFLRLGGFDEKYAGPLVEDIEFTYRIARRYAVIFAPDVRVRHEFEDFGVISRKYFWRAYYWIKLYNKRRKFDPVATTWWEAVTSMTGVLVAGFFALAALTAILMPVATGGVCTPQWSYSGLEAVMVTSRVSWGACTVWNAAFVLATSAFAACALLHALLLRKFLAFIYSEKGFLFMLRGYFVGIILYCYIVAGALWGRIH